jgi:hypothetical protein
MRIEWLGIAEAAARDERGAITLVGVDQNVIVAPSLPVTKERTFLLIADDEGISLAPGSKLTLDVSVTAPSGKVVVAAGAQEVPVGEKRYPDLPGGLKLGGDLRLQITEYGTYSIHVSLTVTASGEVLTADKSIHVVAQPAVVSESKQATAS